MYKLPREWRDAKLVADEQKLAGKLVTEYNKQKVSNAVLKAAEDSDDDDLAGWHLDWFIWLLIYLLNLCLIQNIYLLT